MESFAHPVHQSSRITPVGKDHPQPTKEAGFVDDLFGSITILDVSRGNDHDQNQSESVDQEVAFSTRHLLASIVAAFSGLISHLNRLRVEDGRGRGFFFALLTRIFSRRESLRRCQSPSFCQLAK